METGGAAVRAADIPRASLTVVLVDSTGYGWLPGQKLGDAAMDFRKCGGVETVASIVSGGSIVKAGKKDGTNIPSIPQRLLLRGRQVPGSAPGAASAPQRAESSLRSAAAERRSAAVCGTDRATSRSAGEASNKGRRLRTKRGGPWWWVGRRGRSLARVSADSFAARERCARRLGRSADVMTASVRFARPRSPGSFPRSRLRSRASRPPSRAAAGRQYLVGPARLRLRSIEECHDAARVVVAGARRGHRLSVGVRQTPTPPCARRGPGTRAPRQHPFEGRGLTAQAAPRSQKSGEPSVGRAQAATVGSPQERRSSW